MRPRRIRRGWTLHVHLPARPGPRFNEAPANSPGMAPVPRSSLRSATPGFNEAPANSPGMDVLDAPGFHDILLRFNEAPANSPGMGDG